MLNTSFNIVTKENKSAFYASLLFLLGYFLFDYFFTPFSFGDAEKYINQSCPNLDISGTLASNFFRLEGFSFSNSTNDILWGSIYYLNLLPKKVFFFVLSLFALILGYLTYLHIKFNKNRKFLV